MEFKGKRTVEMYVELRDLPNSRSGEKYLEPLKINGKEPSQYVTFEEALLMTIYGN